MAQYLVRVELFGADADNYERLHACMDVLGLFRTVKYPGSGQFEMPAGTYFGSCNSTKDELLAKIKAFATPQSPKKGPAIFLAQVAGGDWTSSLYPA